MIMRQYPFLHLDTNYLKEQRFYESIWFNFNLNTFYCLHDDKGIRHKFPT